MQVTANQPAQGTKKPRFSWLHRAPKQGQAPAQSQAPAQVKPRATTQATQAKKSLTVGAFFKGLGHSLFTWEWTKALVYWLILSAGTASDLVFLMASFWMSVNANVHGFVLTLMNEDAAKYLTYLATTAYVALPIFIVGLAVVQTVGHIKMWNTGGLWSKIWTVIFGIPAVTFFVMDFVTISCSVVNVTFTMPQFFVILRADSAFVFAFGSLIYFFLGKPQERDRLAEKDGKIEDLQAEMVTSLATLRAEKDRLLADMQAEKDRFMASAKQEKESLLSTIDAKNDEIESLKSLLTETQKGFSELHRAMNKTEEDALQAYGDGCIQWLKSGIKSANVETITRFTGLSTAKVNNALRRGTLKTTPNNKDLILISSLTPWLRSIAVDFGSDRKTEDIPALKLVNS